MATYLQGVTDYLPQIQPFQPDLNFLGNILQTKQSRYDAAHKQLSNVYGTMLNSPMLRDKNISNRDNFFKMIQQDIHKMSGVDLSLQQNVDSAQQVFKALYDDQDIVKDMTWTRNYRNKKEKGASLKLCTLGPEKCGGEWWEGGDQYLDYKAQEFKNAHEYIMGKGGETTIEGNPDVTYKALPNGDIAYSLIATLDEGKEVEEPYNY